MISFTTTIYKFGKMGEKTGWTYIEIDATQAQKINPGVKTAYRTTGSLDGIPFKGVALAPMGEGNFILPLKAELRKKIKKEEGDSLQVSIAHDKNPILIDQDFMDCLVDDERALAHFQSMPGSHQIYFSNWISSAKTIDTKTKRIVKAVHALHRKMNYAEMIREK